MDVFTRLFIKIHVLFYQLSGGLFGGYMAGQSVLLLHTTGRKSGRNYIIPINYYPDNNNYVVVASNWGKDYHPGWFINLQHNPTTTIQIKSRKITVTAHSASGDDYDRLWQYVSSRNKFYNRYQVQTTRKIPLVILTPVD